MSLLRGVLSPGKFALFKELRFVILRRSSISQTLNPAPPAGKEVKLASKKVKQQPFVKDLFLGLFNKEMLVYPEAISRERLAELDKMSETVKRYFRDNVNSTQIDKDGKIPKNVEDDLKQMGLYGLSVPSEYGGLELSATEYARLYEIIGQDSSISRMLGAHEMLAARTILLAGTKEQKEKYLPRLAKGDATAAFCLTEALSGSDPASVDTRALYTADRKMFSVNGRKIWISNGGAADIYIVATKIEKPEIGTEPVGLIIIEKGLAGVEVDHSEETLGVRGCKVSSVSFRDALVPVENLLGCPEDGKKLILGAINSSMFGVAASTVGLLKKLYDSTIEYTIHRDIYEHRLYEFELVKEKLGKVASKIYAMESMIYMTAGILDMVEEPDCILENAILKVFCSEEALWCINQCLKIIGGRSYMKSYPYERYLRDCLAWTLVEGSSDMLKMYIALGGCSYAGSYLEKDIRKMRNPAFNPVFAFKKILTHQKAQTNFFKEDMDLKGHLHPSLKIPANNLEKGVRRFKVAVEQVLARHGQEIVDEQMELERIANIAIELYAMTACLGRSSRAYCIGLMNCDVEILLAHTYCIDAIQKLEKCCDEINKGPLRCNDSNYEQIASTLVSKKGYAIEDPLKHNW